MTNIRRIQDLPPLATVEEVAEVLRCGPRTVSGLCAAGRIDCAKVAGRYLIFGPTAVQAYIEAQTVKEPSSCQSATKGRSSNGGRTGDAGSSNGSSGEEDARIRRASEKAARLRNGSRTSSSTGKKARRPAGVVNLHS
jgi:excisionase family DNA binding protein